jgi:Anti-sigma-K factor rskA
MTAGGSHRDDEHRSWDELAVGWALHALEPEDETVFAAHLESCARCAGTVADTAEVMAAMAADLPQAEPSEGLRERLRAAVEETEQTRPADLLVPRAVPPRPVPADDPPTPPVTPPATPLPPSRFGNLRAPLPVRPVDSRPAWRRVLPTALVAAAVAAVLSLGVWNVTVTSDRDAARAAAAQQSARAAEQSALLDALLAPGRATITPLTDDGRQVATVVARVDQVQVVATGLPVNDRDDSVYVVWGTDSGQPRAIGTFDVLTPQTDLRPVDSTATGLDQYDGYAVSVEPGRQAPSSPTDVVASGQVTS